MEIKNRLEDVGGFVVIIENDMSGDGLAGTVVMRGRDWDKLSAELEERRGELERQYPGKEFGIRDLPGKGMFHVPSPMLLDYASAEDL